MATIRKRKGKWFLEIRKKYFKPIRKTFVYEIDARKYAREKESELDKGFLVSYEQAQSTKFGELLERYRLEIAVYFFLTLSFDFVAFVDFII
tara:strand:+ start:45 stop:320 length:276 start_codon:yes stop_codon:yes gene_type:complete